MSEKIVAKLRSGFITDACGIPLRGSTEKIMDEAADILEQQAKELAEAQARVVVLDWALRQIKTEAHLTLDQRTIVEQALTDTANIERKVREKYYEECAVICEKKALVLYGGYEPTTEYAKGIERGLEKGAEAIRAAKENKNG